MCKLRENKWLWQWLWTCKNKAFYLHDKLRAGGRRTLLRAGVTLPFRETLCIFASLIYKKMHSLHHTPWTGLVVPGRSEEKRRQPPVSRNLLNQRSVILHMVTQQCGQNAYGTRKRNIYAKFCNERDPCKGLQYWGFATSSYKSNMFFRAFVTEGCYIRLL